MFVKSWCAPIRAFLTILVAGNSVTVYLTPIRLTRLLLFTVAMSVSPQSGIAQTSGCLPSLTSDDSRGLLGFARFTVSGMHPGTFRVRAAVGLPLIDTTKVVLTKTAKLCTDAVAGINARLGTPGRVRRIYLAKLNTDGYMAVEPVDVPESEWRPVYLLTRHMAVSHVIHGL